MKKFLSNLLVKLLIRKSTVLENQKIGEHFQLLTIKLPKKKDWIPGQKIQIKINETELRSYTPSHWNKDQKTFKTLIYNHKQGPGAKWSATVLPETKVQVVGPRKSLELTHYQTNLIFFGDETTYGLAHALMKSNTKRSMKCFFETNCHEDSKTVLNFLELPTENLITCMKDDLHLRIILEKIKLQIKDEIVILSGKQSSINFLARAFLEGGIPKERIIKKRYWGWKNLNHLTDRQSEILN